MEYIEILNPREKHFWDLCFPVRKCTFFSFINVLMHYGKELQNFEPNEGKHTTNIISKTRACKVILQSREGFLAFVNETFYDKVGKVLP